MSLKLKPLLSHRKHMPFLVMSCLVTVSFMSLTRWTSVGQPRDIDEKLKRHAVSRASGSDHETGSSHRSTGSAGNKPATRSRSVRILCWIMTDPHDLEVRVIHVKNTWAKRCDVTLFFSSQTNKIFPTIGIDVPPGREHLAVKSRESWTHVFRHHYNDADYFVKADPDTYVLVENLRQYLSHCDPLEPEAFGHRLNYRHHLNVTYFSGAAIVLSREALRRLVTVGYANYKHYIDEGKAEDLKNALCLHEVGVRFVDTRDLNGRETFLPLILSHHLFPSSAYIPNWYQRYRDNDFKTGKQCCSDRPVAFHYVKPMEMYSFDYLIRITDGSRRDTEACQNNDECQLQQQQRQKKMNQNHLQPNGKILMFRGTRNNTNLDERLEPSGR